MLPPRRWPLMRSVTWINRKPVGDAALGVPRAVEGDRPYRSFAIIRRTLQVRS